MKTDGSLLNRLGSIYIFTLIVAYISSSIYNNLGGTYIAEILKNNLHYAASTEGNSGQVDLVCSLKNTGYSTLKDVKLLIWSTEPGFSNTELDSEMLSVVSQERKTNFIHTVYRLENDIYPGETKTVRFVFKKNPQSESVRLDTTNTKPFKIKVYSSNTAAIEVSSVTEKTKFAIGPYLYDLLWVVGWTYLDIGLFIVLPLALIIFLIFAILTRLLKPAVGRREDT